MELCTREQAVRSEEGIKNMTSYSRDSVCTCIHRCTDKMPGEQGSSNIPRVYFLGGGNCSCPCINKGFTNDTRAYKSYHHSIKTHLYLFRSAEWSEDFWESALVTEQIENSPFSSTPCQENGWPSEALLCKLICLTNHSWNTFTGLVSETSLGIGLTISFYTLI